MFKTWMAIVGAGLFGCAAPGLGLPQEASNQPVGVAGRTVPLEREIGLPLPAPDERDLRLLAADLQNRLGLPPLRRLVLGSIGSPLDRPVAKLLFLRDLGGGRLALIWFRARHRDWCAPAGGGPCPEAPVVLTRGAWRLLPAERIEQAACRRSRHHPARRPAWLPETAASGDPAKDWVAVGRGLSCGEFARLERALDLAGVDRIDREVHAGSVFYRLTIRTGSHSWLEQRYRLEADGRLVLIDTRRAIS